MKRSSKFYFDREKQIMRRLELTPTIASGSKWVEKEDGYNDEVLAQLKSTEHESFRITLDDLKKLEYHAAVDHKAPAFFIDFITEDRLYLVVEVSNVEEVYNSMFNKESPTSVEPAAAELIDLVADTGEAVGRVAVGSGDKKKYWEDQQKANENKRKGK